MLRTHTCGELTLLDKGKEVTLCGWMQRSRDLGGMTFIDLRDRYGLTQLVFNMDTHKELCEQARKLGREFVLKVSGVVTERSSKNAKLVTGEIEILVHTLEVLNQSITPPFTIEDESDGGDDLRMKYRYLDLRRNPLKNNLLKRHQVGREVRSYLDGQGFADIETPFLIKSTPEGARDFVVPSRLNQGEFYALPQSPQTFKQLLMVSGFDRYYQIVRCFRDEDLRADRQPEFTQIDCEMTFVERDDVLNMFEGMVKHVFQKVRGLSLSDFPKMSYHDAMHYYGNDKPDTRFEMKFVHLNEEVKAKGFKVFDEAECVVAIAAKGCSEYTRKQLDELTEFVKKPQIGASGLVYIKCNVDGTLKSSVDKFYTESDLKIIAERMNATAGDLILILSGVKGKTLNAMSELRLEMGARLGMRDPEKFAPLWVVDFPLFEYNEEDGRYYAMHHPFTAARPEDAAKLLEHRDLNQIKANAYDLVINGVEIGGGSVRIYHREMQEAMFKALGLNKEEAEYKFGFILKAFEYGAPPHAGIAFGFDRFCSIVISNESYIREYIAFPKNNSGRDIMLDAPSDIDDKQRVELGLKKYFATMIQILRNTTSFGRILIFIGLCLISTSLVSLFGILLLKPLFGLSAISILDSSLKDPQMLNALKFLQFLQQIGLFILPAFVFAYLMEGKLFEPHGLNVSIHLKYVALVVMLIFASQPLINFLVEWNSRLALPVFFHELEAWMKQSEEAATKLTEAFLDMHGILDFSIMFLIVAIIPAFGEELLFRGVLQRLFISWLKNKHIGILITSILFSALHMQFFGFVPRMLLGMLLGYLFLWSGSLWLPILAHLTNNGMAVIFAYVSKNNLVSFDLDSFGTGEGEFQWISLSVLLVAVITRYFYKNRIKETPVFQQS